MEVLEAIRSRRAVREFSDKKIEAEKLEKILEAGRLAPTAGNQQRTKIIVVTRQDLKERLVDACKGQRFVGTAPAVLAVCADGDRKMLCGQSARTVDCAICLSFMRLEAVEQGLQGCWLGMFDEKKVREILAVPEDYIIAALCPIGYAAKDGTPRDKKHLSDILVRETMEDI